MIKHLLKFTITLSLIFATWAANGREIYVCADNGDDTKGDGSKNAPYATITQGVKRATNGTDILVRGGVYREAITIDKDDISISAYEDEYVLVSGLIPVERWKKDGDRWIANVDRSKIDKEIAYTQFFVNGSRREPARYPDSDGDNFSFFEWMPSTTLPAEGDKGNVVLEESFPENYWQGGYYIGLNSNIGNSFNCAKGVIRSSDNDTLHCEDICWNWVNNWSSTVGKGQGYVIHHLNAMDSPGEWYYDNNESLYYIPIEGEKPKKESFEIRAKLYVVKMAGCKGVTLRGINFKAGLLRMDNTTNCVVDRCTFRYLSPISTHNVHPYGSTEDGSLGIYISGEGNKLTNSYIGSSWAGCLTLEGQNTVVTNNILDSGNWMAERFGILNIYDKGAKITHNTIRNAVRGAVDGGNRFWINKWGSDYEFAYNHIYNALCMSVDGGVFYVNTKGNQYLLNTTIHHNWVGAGHKGELMRIRGKSGLSHTRAGIYADDGTSGIDIHHNVIYSTPEAIKTNCYNLDLEIYNNTFVDCLLSHTRIEPKPIREREVITRNNISIKDAQMNGTSNSDNLNIDYNEDIWVDWRNLDFRLKPNITTADVGAYKYGEPRWVAGADWEITDDTFQDQGQYASIHAFVKDLSMVYPTGSSVPELRWSENFEGDYKVNVYHLKDAGRGVTKIGSVERDVCRFAIDDFIGSDERCWFVLRLERPDGVLMPLSNEVPFLRHTSLDDDCMTQTMQQLVQLSIRWADKYPPLAGNVGQFTRNSIYNLGSNSYVTWHVASIQDFESMLIIHDTEDINLFSVHLSEDGVVWHEAKDLHYSDIEMFEEGVYTCHLSNGVLSGRDNFIKIKIAGKESNTDYPSIAHMKVNTRKK